MTLEADVMTVHYDDYYQGQNVPGDWLNPTPIPFLVVATGQGVQFAVSPRRSISASCKDCEHVIGLMCDALESIGEGTKTASGNGRFEADDAMEATIASRVNAREREQAAQTARMADASAAAKELMADILANDWTDNRDNFLAPGRLESWIERLASDPRKDAIKLLMELATKHLPQGLLANPEATKANQKPKFSDRQQKIGIALNKLKDA